MLLIHRQLRNILSRLCSISRREQARTLDKSVTYLINRMSAATSVSLHEAMFNRVLATVGLSLAGELQGTGTAQ